MSKKLKGWLFALAVVVILMIPILIDYYGNKSIDVISYSDYVDLVDSGDFAVVYFGNTDEDDFADIKESLASLKNEFDLKSIKTVNYADLTEAELEELSTIIEDESAYVFIKDSKVAYVSNESLTLTKLKTLVDKYYNDIIPEDEIAYKSVATKDEYMKIVNGKKIIMTVFGTDDCSWCNKFKPVYNYIAADYDLDVYYLNSKTFNKDEYSKILNSGLKIPAACTDSGQDELLSTGFGTPLTLFTKNGKAIDCIPGYVNEENLLAKLKSVGMIK